MRNSIARVEVKSTIRQLLNKLDEAQAQWHVLQSCLNNAVGVSYFDTERVRIDALNANKNNLEFRDFFRDIEAAAIEIKRIKKQIIELI